MASRERKAPVHAGRGGLRTPWPAAALVAGFALAAAAAMADPVTLRPEGEIRALAWRADGRQLVCAGTQLTLWDATTGRRLRALALPDAGPVEAVHCGPKGRWLAVRCARGVRVWDRGRRPVDLVGWTGRLGIDPSGRYLVEARLAQREVRLWSGTTGRPLRTIGPLRGSLEGIGWDADGDLLTAGAERRLGRLTSNIATFSRHDGRRSGGRWLFGGRWRAFLADGRTMLLTTPAGAVLAADVESAERLATLTGLAATDAVHASSDGRWLGRVSGARLDLWAARTGVRRPAVPLAGTPRALALGPAGRLAVAYPDGRLVLQTIRHRSPVVRLEVEDASAWLLTSTGPLYAYRSAPGELVELDPATGRVRGRIPVAGAPRAVCAAADRLVLLGRDPVALRSLDPATGVSTRLPLPARASGALCAVPGRARVLVFGRGQLSCVALDGGATETAPLSGRVERAVMSPDGDWLLTAQAAQGDRVTLTAHRVRWEPFALRPVGRCVAPRARLYAGLRHWWIGGRRWTRALTEATADRGPELVAEHPRRLLTAIARWRWVGPLGAHRLTALTLAGGDGAPAQLSLIGSAARDTGPPRTSARAAVLRIDAARDRVLVASPGQAVLVHLSRLGLQVAPRLLLRSPGDQRVTVGQALSCRVEPTVPELRAASELTVRGLAGARIERGRLTWRAGRVGLQRATVAARWGAQRDRIGFDVEVLAKRPTAADVVTAIAIDPDGRHAWLAVDGELRRVALGSGDALARRPLPGVTGLWPAAGALYAAGGERLLRLDPSALTEQASARLGFTVREVLALSDARLVAHDGARRAVVLDARSLAELDRPRLDPPPSAPGVARVPGGVRIGGRVFGEDGRVVRLLAPQLPALIHHDCPGDPPPAPAGRWGVRLEADGGLVRLVEADGRFRATWDGDAAALHPSLPLAVSLRHGPAALTLTYHQLVSGAVRHTVTFAVPDEPVLRVARLAVGREVVAIADGPRLHVQRFDSGAAWVRALPRPLRLHGASRTPPVIGLQPLTVQLAADGGRGPLTYAIDGIVSGVTVDGRSGRLTVDLPALWRALSERELARFDRRPHPTLTDARINTRAREQVRLLTGVAPVGVPWCLTLPIVVRDAGGQTVRLRFVLVVDVDPERRDASRREARLLRVRKMGRSVRGEPRQRAPLLWRVEGPAGPTWLLGSIHRGVELGQLSDETLARVLDAQRLVLETVLPESEALLARMQLPGDVRLEDLVGELTAYAVIDRLVPEHHAQAQQLRDRIRRTEPWGLVQLLVAKGLPSHPGMDRTLQVLATKVWPRPVEQLEPWTAGLEALARQPRAYWIAELRRLLAEPGSRRRALRAVCQAYLAGDAERVWALTFGEADAGTRALLDDLLTRRNQAWLPRIEGQLRRGGAVIVVGAAHLVGAKGIVELLRERGHVVGRVGGPERDWRHDPPSLAATWEPGPVALIAGLVGTAVLGLAAVALWGSTRRAAS